MHLLHIKQDNGFKGLKGFLIPRNVVGVDEAKINAEVEGDLTHTQIKKQQKL